MVVKTSVTLKCPSDSFQCHVPISSCLLFVHSSTISSGITPSTTSDLCGRNNRTKTKVKTWSILSLKRAQISLSSSSTPVHSSCLAIHSSYLHNYTRTWALPLGLKEKWFSGPIWAEIWRLVFSDDNGWDSKSFRLLRKTSKILNVKNLFSESLNQLTLDFLQSSKLSIAPSQWLLSLLIPSQWAAERMQLCAVTLPWWSILSTSLLCEMTWNDEAKKPTTPLPKKKTFAKIIVNILTIIFEKL